MILRLVRRLASVPGVRLLTRLAPLLRISFALRGMLVSEPLRFAWNELRKRHGVSIYSLRDAPVKIALRHGTPDVMVLDEVFSQHEYEFPQAVLAVLGTRGPELRVVDLGANIGLFGAWVLTRFPKASIVALEADPENVAVHEAALAANERAQSWRLIGAAAGTRPGTDRFVSGAFAVSHVARDSEESIEIPVEDVFAHLGEVDLLKIDIEGSEWELLADPRFPEIAARVVVLEYHTEGCPADDPAKAAARLLRAAGFELFAGPRKPRFGAGVYWAVRG